MKEVSGGIEFAEFDKKALVNIMTYCYKNVNEVLSNCLFDDEIFNDHSMVKDVSVAISGCHCEGLPSMMLSVHIELKK